MSRSKQELRVRRHWRVRKKVQGTTERPRLSVCFTQRHIQVQVIDDLKGCTLASVSTLEESFGQDAKNKANKAAAVQVGKLIAERALARQVKQVVFDRGGSKYHGKVKALADAAREAGMIF